MKSPDELDAHIGARVRLRRIMLGVSQEQLGTALGLTFQQIQKYEKGLNRIGAGRLYRIATALSVSVAFFYEGLPDPRDKAGDGDSGNGDAIQRFLTSPEGYSLCEAFMKIEDRATRRRLVDLVSTIADQ